MTEAEKNTLRSKLEDAAHLVQSVAPDWEKCTDDGFIHCNCKNEAMELKHIAQKLADIAGISLEVR